MNINLPTPTDIPNILRILRAVRVTLTPPAAWTRNVHARNKHDQPINPYDETATCYDIVGAIIVVSDRANLKAHNHSTIMYLRNFTDGKEIGRWNDEQGRSLADVHTMLDKSIKHLEEISNA